MAGDFGDGGTGTAGLPAGGDPVAVVQADREPVTDALQPRHMLGEQHVRAEHPGLLARPPGQLVPADPVREAGVVADHRAASGLTAGKRPLPGPASTPATALGPLAKPS